MIQESDFLTADLRRFIVSINCRNQFSDFESAVKLCSPIQTCRIKLTDWIFDAIAKSIQLLR